MSEKTVRVTLELPNSFLRLLNAKADLAGWTRWGKEEDNPPELDAGSIVGWLVLMEARGQTEALQHAATPMMWRMAGGPEVVHSERRVYEQGKLISGPNLEARGADSSHIAP